VIGEIEVDGKVLVIRRVHAHYRLRAGEDQREVIERVHATYAEFCPIARSIKGSIEVRTSFELVD
jgi:organic hydroperoxide reductase OsmC/OhrA